MMEFLNRTFFPIQEGPIIVVFSSKFCVMPSLIKVPWFGVINSRRFHLSKIFRFVVSRSSIVLMFSRHPKLLRMIPLTGFFPFISILSVSEISCSPFGVKGVFLRYGIVSFDMMYAPVVNNSFSRSLFWVVVGGTSIFVINPFSLSFTLTILVFLSCFLLSIFSV